MKDYQYYKIILILIIIKLIYKIKKINYKNINQYLIIYWILLIYKFIDKMDL